MKIIELPDLKEPSAPEILKGVLENIPRGARLDELRRRIRIMDVLEKASGSLTLEDADHALLKSVYAEFPFTRALPGIVALGDAIDAAQEAK